MSREEPNALIKCPIDWISDQIELSRLIDIVNQRFGTEFKPADQLFFDRIREEAVADTQIQQAVMGLRTPTVAWSCPFSRCEEGWPTGAGPRRTQDAAYSPR